MTPENQTLIEKGTIVSLDGNGMVYKSGYLQITGDKITAIGSGEAPELMRSTANTHPRCHQYGAYSRNGEQPHSSIPIIYSRTG